MKIVQEEILINQGNIAAIEQWGRIRAEIYQAIASVIWPEGSSQFVINPVRHGNRVKPVQKGCMLTPHERYGWQLEAPVFIREVRRAGKVDALKATALGDFVFE